MRRRLAVREGIRGTFTATFERFGSKNGYKGGTVPTLLFHNVHDHAGTHVCDHLWFTWGQAWRRLAPRPGDRVRFDARVKLYTKGHGQAGNVSIDYKLCFPTKLGIVGSCALRTRAGA
jgi:hypothetical protein